MRVVLHTTHLGDVGGGENYMMRLAMALSKFTDLAVVRNWPKSFEEKNGFYQTFPIYTGIYKPDLFVYCSHFISTFPIGHRNAIVSLFPKKQLKPKGNWDVVSICDFTARHVLDSWGLPSSVIWPCIDTIPYRQSAKRKKIVSVGHFFQEEDGHSKNQHILCDAFNLDGYELVLLGNASANDRPYVEKVISSAAGKNVRIELNKAADRVREELSDASHLWHANGYGRSNPAQTEHFGIVVLEALASGAIPIVHKSGGAAEIDGVVTWEQPEELAKLTQVPREIPQFPKQFTIKHFEDSVERWISGIGS